MKKQTGFTLIELVMVIVILGILAATALPKFFDLSGDANQAVANGVAAAIASSATIQYSANAISSTRGYTASTACTAGTYLTPANLPAGCTATYSAPTCSVTCSGKLASATLP